MIKDLINTPLKIIIDGEEFNAEFDNRAYMTLEEFTGKSIFQIYEELTIKNSLGLKERIDVACAGLLKHHTEDEIKFVREALTEKNYLLMKNMAAVSVAFVKPLMPPEIIKNTPASRDLKKKTKNKKA